MTVFWKEAISLVLMKQSYLNDSCLVLKQLLISGGISLKELLHLNTINVHLLVIYYQKLYYSDTEC